MKDDGAEYVFLVFFGGASRCTHKILIDSSRGLLEVVPWDEENEEEGQHVELPVPHRHQEDLKERSEQKGTGVWKGFPSPSAVQS